MRCSYCAAQACSCRTLCALLFVAGLVVMGGVDTFRAFDREAARSRATVRALASKMLTEVGAEF